MAQLTMAGSGHFLTYSEYSKLDKETAKAVNRYVLEEHYEAAFCFLVFVSDSTGMGAKKVKTFTAGVPFSPGITMKICGFKEFAWAGAYEVIGVADNTTSPNASQYLVALIAKKGSDSGALLCHVDN